MNPIRVAFVAVGLLAVGVAGLGAQGKSTILQKIIVKVNGEIFTQSELEQMQIQALRDQNRQVASPESLATDAGLKAALAQVTPELLMEAVDDLLLMQHGRELGIKFTEENFKLAIENLKKENKLDDRQFDAALKQEGLTIQDLRQNFERTWIVRNVLQREVMRNVTLTDEEARQYYKAHPDQFMKPPSVTVREILVAVPTETVGGQPAVNAAADEAAKGKIAALRARAVKGEDFVALVAEASESGTKANAGLIGPVLTADLAPAVGAALDKLKVGEISEPLRTRNGYQIFKLESRTEAELETFDKSRNLIAQRIYDARLETERAKFLERLKKQALIEWKDETYQKMFEQAQAQRAKTG